MVLLAINGLSTIFHNLFCFSLSPYTLPLPLLLSLSLCTGETDLRKQFQDVFKLVRALWGPGEDGEERGKFQVLWSVLQTYITLKLFARK